MQRILLFLLAAAALATLAFLALDLGGGAAAPDRAPGAAPRRAGTQPSPAGASLEQLAAERQVVAPADASAARAEPGAPPAGAQRAGDDDLVIAVRDAAGEPVPGVPVGVRIDAAGSQLLWRSVTEGAAGTARFAGGSAQIRETADLGTRHAAVLAFPLAGGPEVALDRAALPREPVVLVLPPTGAVEIVIDDAAGVPAADLEVELRSPQELLQGPGFVAAGTAKPENGVARFAWVGLGQDLRAVARRAGQNLPAVLDFAGPRLPGQTVVEHVMLQPADARPVLVMHVHDPLDAPVADEDLRIVMIARRPGSTSTGTFNLRTDSRGVLRLLLEDGLGEQAERRLQLRATSMGARVAVPDVLRAGDNDLGVVRLQPPPRLCSGIVLGPDGKPVEGAHVSVSLQRREGTSAWREPLRDTEAVTTGADGRFAVHGEAGEGELGVEVAAAGFRPLGPEPFARGAELRLVLEAAATVTGTVLLGEVIEIQDVVVELSQDGRTVQERLQRRGSQGAFEFTGLPGGTASVRLRVLGERGGLLVDGVLLRPGEVTADPRLQDVDLAAGRRAVRFTVVGTDGLPVAEARAVVVPEDPRATSFEGHMLDHGAGRVVTGRASLSLIAFASDHRTRRVDGVADGQTITLPPALAVRLRLPQDCRVPDGSWRLEVSMRPRGAVAEGSYVLYRGMTGTQSGDGSLPWQSPAGAECGPAGDAVLRVPEPGSWIASWRLQRGRRSAAVGDDVTLTVDDVAGEQGLPAGITAAQLERAVEELR
jgi:hypothetical protein